MVESQLRPFWVCIRGGDVRVVRAHDAAQIDDDLVLFTTGAGGSARMTVAHFPLSMVEAWRASPPAA